MRSFVSAGELAELLRQRIEPLVAEILVDVRREGGELRGRGPDGAVWSVVVRGAKTGVWANWGSDEQKGDPLELIRWAKCNGDRRAAWRWALRWLGLDGGTPVSAGPAAPTRTAPEPSREEARLAARARFRAGQGPVWATPAGRYLEHRGLGCELGPLPALRFARRSWHSREHGQLPALLAAVIDPASSRFLALHCTYLRQDGGGWRKALVGPAKKIFAPVKGGVIALIQGASGRPLRTAPEGDRAVIGEGIENTLTAALLEPERRALAAVSVGNLKALKLPPAITDILLIIDRDGENGQVRALRAATLARWQDEGRQVTCLEPTPGYKDLNEQWQAILDRR
jgi:hypothetical protein